MAFCNSCGAALNPGTRFCNKCGAAVLASAPASAFRSAAPAASSPPVPAATAQATPSQGSGALKIILIVVGVFVLIGILGVASVGFFAWRVARHTHVRQDGNNVKVETPFGTVESTKDPEEAARNLGVDIYPGAQVLKDGTASASFGGVHTVYRQPGKRRLCRQSHQFLQVKVSQGHGDRFGLKPEHDRLK